MRIRIVFAKEKDAENIKITMIMVIDFFIITSILSL